MSRDSGTLEVFASPQDVAAALARLFIDEAHASLAMRGRFAVSLAGGTTPKAAYALLAQLPDARALDWNAIDLFFGDERCVPPDHEQSNYRMARLAFLDALGIPSARVHRMRGEDDPQAAARAYRDDLVAALGTRPRLDLALLGMGPDGHTASLFPGTDPHADDAALVRAVYAPSQAQWRLTLTPQVLDAARTVAFTVEGAAKAAMLKTVREGPYEPSRFPAQSIAPSDGRLLWLVDRAAAGISA